MSMFSNLPGYDAWKTHNPKDDFLGEREHDCTCGRTRKSRRDCPVHGVDPDTQYDQWRDDHMDKDR